jgi:hypothetical protein
MKLALTAGPQWLIDAWRLNRKFELDEFSPSKSDYLYRYQTGSQKSLIPEVGE